MDIKTANEMWSKSVSCTCLGFKANHLLHETNPRPESGCSEANKKLARECEEAFDTARWAVIKLNEPLNVTLEMEHKMMREYIVSRLTEQGYKLFETEITVQPGAFCKDSGLCAFSEIPTGHRFDFVDWAFRGHDRDNPLYNTLMEFEGKQFEDPKFLYQGRGQWLVGRFRFNDYDSTQPTRLKGWVVTGNKPGSVYPMNPGFIGYIDYGTED